MYNDSDRLRSAYAKVCNTLLARRNTDGYWTGTLSASSLSTAVAVSAFSIFLKKVKSSSGHYLTPEEFQQLESLIPQSTDWLVAHQNPDGGWGDTDKSLSNVSTTVLVQSALVLAEHFIIPSPPGGEGTLFNPPPRELNLLSRRKGDEYLRQVGGIDAIKARYGSDQTFAVPILTNAALAGLVDWKEVPQLPFELAALPMAWFRFVKLNVVSYAVPALVAVGQVRFHHAPAKGQPIRNFCCNFFRRLAQKRTLRLIEKMQPESGGYLEAAPLTAFVAMSLSAMGLTDHPIVTKGLRFLLATVREDGSWPIDTNLATWLTSLSLGALQEYNSPPSEGAGGGLWNCAEKEKTLNWLVSCQHRQRHPFTGAQPGGWGWTNLTGSVPDADDTAGALLALAMLERRQTADGRRQQMQAYHAGLNWLLNLQNRDGGMPTFCRGWGMLPFDQSSTDITAHTLRALHAAQERGGGSPPVLGDLTINRGAPAPRSCAIHPFSCKMLAFLKRSQQPDGSWFPLWFGNQFMPDDANPFYGTAKVLLALAEVDPENNMIPKGLQYLIANQNSDGGWGSKESSVEETAVVIEALSMFTETQGVSTAVYHAGLHWLLNAVDSDRFLKPSPIGLYFAKLWYYEELYPIIFTASALRRAVDRNRHR